MKLLDSRQEAKQNMYQVVEAHCVANPTIVSANVAFSAALNDFAAKSARINADAQKAGTNLTGVAVDKTVAKQNLIRNATKIAGLIYAYAAKNGNNTLKQSVNFSKTDFGRLKDGELAAACQNIHDLGIANQSSLGDFGVTDEKLEALQTAVDAYAANVAKPRTAIVDRKTTKANIRQWFKDADFILTEQMDRLIEDFAADHPDFVAQYKNARIIIDPRTGKKMQNEPKADNGELITSPPD